MSGKYKLIHPLDSQVPPHFPPRAADSEGHVAEEQPSREIRNDASTTEVTSRPFLAPHKDAEVMRNAGLTRQYLHDTGIVTHLNKFTVELLKSQVLPYNPYPGYARRFRRLSQKFHAKKESLQSVQKRTAQCPTFLTSGGIIAGVKLPDVNLWGLQHVLSATNPDKLKVYANLAKTCNAPMSFIAEKCGNGVSSFTALVGPGVFVGSVHDQFWKLELVTSVIVESADFQQAAKQFGNAVLSDLEYIHRSATNLLLSLQVPVDTGNGLQNKTWSVDEVSTIFSSEGSVLRDSLVQMIGFAALKKQDPCVQLLLKPPSATIGDMACKYFPAEKCYNMMTLVGRPGGGPASLYISTSPFQLLHEGVFLDKEEAEMYVKTFTRHSSSKSPMAAAITSAIQKKWQENIAGYQLESEILKIMHKFCLMERVQNQMKPSAAKNEESIAIEICRLSQCPALRLEHISTISAFLHLVASSPSLCVNGTVLLDLLSGYETCLKEFFNEGSHSLSSAMLSAKFVIGNCFENIRTLVGENDFKTMRSKVYFVKGYLKAVSIGLVEDALEEFPMIRRTKSQIDGIAGRSFGSNLNTDDRINVYKHRLETEGYAHVDDKMLDVAQCAGAIRAPQNVSSQVAMMQYCIDVRIDEVWLDFLKNTILFQASLPPNPYPNFVSALRRASLKVQLFRREDSALAKYALPQSPKLFDGKHKIYNLPGIPAFGHFCAVSTLSSVGYRQVSSIAIRVAISPPSPGGGVQTLKVDSFALRCLPSLSGEMLLYGSATPFLTSVTLHEHCFLRGSGGKLHEGIMSLGKLLLDHLGNLQVQGVLPLKARFSQKTVELYDVAGASASFRNALAVIAENRQPVYVHVLVPLEWRYVEVVKVIHLYYINEMNEEGSRITEPISSKSFVEVFFSASDAIEYKKRCVNFEQPRVQSESAILNHVTERNWSTLAHMVLVESLDSGKTLTSSDIGKVAFCWRLHHSCVGSLRYVTAIAEALASVLKYSRGCAENARPRQGLVEAMLMGFRNALNSVLTQPSALASASLNSYCQHLLQMSAPCNLTNGFVDLGNKGFLIGTLRHVSSVVQSVQDALAMDLIQCTPSVADVAKLNASTNGTNGAK